MLQLAESPLDEKARRRFLEKIAIPVDPDGHWIWTAYLDHQGYGKFHLGRRNQSQYAHRVGYQHWVGPIPEGLELDHLCKVRACCNPAHLEPVTHEENLHRGDMGINNSRKTHCAQGHEFTPENTKPQKGGRGRTCRECHRAGGRRRYAEKQAGR